MMLLRTTAFICRILYHATLAASVPSGYAKSFFLFSTNGFDRLAHKPIWHNIRPMTTYIIGCLALIIKPGPDLMCTIATALSEGRARAFTLMFGLIAGVKRVRAY